ncbi:MAG: putative Ig domain-containing protein [Rhodospirillales bacterium]|nr:putative Ig domain-containing protein [Rhodospirillales bacterium]
MDGSGNVYTTGSFNGTGDFDPGAGTTDLTSAGGTDTFVQKLDATGALVWARAMGGGADSGSRIALDGSSYVYASGTFTGTADFDPGAGTRNLIGGGATAAFVSRLDLSGNFVVVNNSPTGAVSVSGTATQGQTLTGSNTLADADGLGTVSYQWQSSPDGNTWSAINGATASTFTLTQAQVGRQVRVVASYTDGQNTAESVASGATAAVANPDVAPIITSPPPPPPPVAPAPVAQPHFAPVQADAGGPGPTGPVTALRADNGPGAFFQAPTIATFAPSFAPAGDGRTAAPAVSLAAPVAAPATRAADAGPGNIGAPTGPAVAPAAPAAPAANPAGAGAFQVATIADAGPARAEGVVAVRPVVAVETQGTQINFRLPGDTFASASADRAVSLAATQADGAALPSWLSFDPATGTFQGTPPAGLTGEMVVRVVARDAQGNEAVATVRINAAAGAGNQGQGQGNQADGAQAPGQQGDATPVGDARVINLADARNAIPAGKPAFAEQLRMASRLNGARQAQLLAAARAVAASA